jgi:hypothetical protein
MDFPMDSNARASPKMGNAYRSSPHLGTFIAFLLVGAFAGPYRMGGDSWR